MFFKRLIDLKNDKVKIKIIPKTDEEYISLTYGCIRFFESYRFVSESLDNLVKILVVDDFKIFRKEFPDKWQYLNKKLAYPCQYFNTIDDYQKPVDKLKREDFFSKINIKCPDDDEIERTKEIFKLFDIKNGEELTKLHCKKNDILLAVVIKNSLKYLLKSMVLIL